MELNGLFKFAREVQGIKQSELAKKAGIAQPSLSQFENGQSTLSLDTLCTMAPFLNINPKHVTGESANPFQGTGLIKMLFPETFLTGMDYSPLDYVVMMNFSLEVVFLIATSRVKAFDKVISKTVVGQFTQAVLVRDQDGNIFIFRRKHRGAYLVGELDVQARLAETAKKEKKEVSVQSRRISREVSQKIDDWTVAREDVEEFFVPRVRESLTIEEDRLIKEIRSGGYDPEEVRALFSRLKKKKIN